MTRPSNGDSSVTVVYLDMITFKIINYVTVPFSKCASQISACHVLYCQLYKFNSSPSFTRQLYQLNRFPFVDTYK